MRKLGGLYTVPRLLGYREMKLLDITDSSPTTLLVALRLLARDVIGDCRLAAITAEAIGADVQKRETALKHHKLLPILPELNLDEVRYLVQWFSYSSRCILDIFDGEQLVADVLEWFTISDRVPGTISAVYYMVLAIGALSCPLSNDITAEAYYAHARCLCAFEHFNDTDLATVQYYTLVTMYLITRCRMEQAYIQFGLAVRGAHVLRLNDSQPTATPHHFDFQDRDRLWTAIRILDVQLSAVLGRPMTTTDPYGVLMLTQSTTSNLSILWDMVLGNAFLKSPIEPSMLEMIVYFSQQSAGQFRPGLETDGLQCSDLVEHDGLMLPNLGYCYARHAFYGSIMLLTQHFLCAAVAAQIFPLDSSSSQYSNSPHLDSFQLSPHAMSHVCLQAAMTYVEIFRGLLVTDQRPSRAPYVTHGVFHAALLLGLGIFGNISQATDLLQSLAMAGHILRAFESRDANAAHYAKVIEDLRLTCETYADRRNDTAKRLRQIRMEQLFGQLDIRIDDATTTVPGHVAQG